MKKRIITACVLALFLVPAIIFGGVYYLIISMLFGIVGTYELMNMFYKKDESLKNMRFVLPAFSAIIIFLFYKLETVGDCYSFVMSDDVLNFIEDITKNDNLFTMYSALILGVFLLFVIIIMICSIFTKNTTAHYISSCVLSLTYGGLLLGAAFAIEYVQPISFKDNDLWGGQLFAYLYVVVAGTDMFAYFIGSKFGKHKLCPSISPKKSVEGAIGGLVCGSLFGVLASWLFKVMPVNSDSSAGYIVVCILVMLLVSILISIVVQVGDLVASKLKRTYEIKDYGNIFPGHGGVMDRFDSLILSGSFLYVVIMIIKLISIGAM